MRVFVREPVQELVDGFVATRDLGPVTVVARHADKSRNGVDADLRVARLAFGEVADWESFCIEGDDACHSASSSSSSLSFHRAFRRV